MKGPSSKVYLAVLTAIAVCACAFVWFRWKYPFGPKDCRMPCMMSALLEYARSNDGWFPRSDGTNNTDALRQLVPTFLDARELAGISGDDEAVEVRIRMGERIDESVSSLVYWPGFRRDDSQELAIIWDTTSGVNGIGHRSSFGSHAVGFVGGIYRQVSGEKWNSFLVEQQILRSNILSSRSILNH